MRIEESIKWHQTNYPGWHKYLSYEIEGDYFLDLSKCHPKWFPKGTELSTYSLERCVLERDCWLLAVFCGSDEPDLPEYMAMTSRRYDDEQAVLEELQMLRRRIKG